MPTHLELDVNVNVQDYGAITKDAVQKLAASIRAKARSNIASAGNFGRRFTSGLKTSVKRISGAYVVNVTQSPGFAKAFEYGVTSVGQPLLWIPVATDSKGKRARNYPGRLYRPGPKGAKKNVLISATDGQVKYVGVPRVQIPKRFNIRGIAEQEANKFLENYGR